MTDAVAKSFGYQLNDLEQYIQANYNWESPESAFARYVYYRSGATTPFTVPEDTVIQILEPRRLQEAPILAAVGYEIASGRGFSESFLEAWANGFTRLASREAFPSDRASFFFRPVELLGISLGAKNCPKVHQKDLIWLREVLTSGEQKLGSGDLWTFILGIYAAQSISVNWKSPNLPLPEEMNIDELALVKWVCSFDSHAAQRFGFTQHESEIDKTLLSRCITRPTVGNDNSRAAVLYLSLKKTVILLIQFSCENYWLLSGSSSELFSLIKSLCTRFHSVTQQLKFQKNSLEITDGYSIKDLLPVLSQLRSDIDVVVARANEAMLQKCSTHILHNQGTIITQKFHNQGDIIMSEISKQINNDLKGAQLAGGLVNSDTVNAEQIGGDITNYAQEQKQKETNNSAVKTILILASNPRNTSQLRLDEEVREIDAGLQRAKKRELFDFKQRWAVRVQDVYQTLLDFKPQFVHFCGHGLGDDGLVLEDEDGNLKLVDTEALAKLFELFSTTIECVVLNACYSEVQAIAITKHIPYVIGMNQAIGDKAAIKFATGFYNALGAGESIEFAHKLGCNVIQLDGIPEHLTPVLKKR